MLLIQGISKGLAVDKLIQTLINNGKAPDFLMCIGNDRFDEEMFESINNKASSSVFATAPEVLACSVGQKPSKAKYYVDDTAEVIRLLKNVSGISSQPEVVSQGRVTFRDVLDYVE